MAGTHHGIPEDEVDAVLAALGVSEHTPEDCHLSEMLHSASGYPTVVMGQHVWLAVTGDADDAWVHMRLPAGTRRRLLNNPSEGTVELEPWNGPEGDT